jgi:hypothetical protein
MTILPPIVEAGSYLAGDRPKGKGRPRRSAWKPHPENDYSAGPGALFGHAQ